MSPIPALFYMTNFVYSQSLTPEEGEMNYLIPMKGYSDRGVAVEAAIIEFLKKKYQAETVAVEDTTWTITLGYKAPFLSKTMLSLHMVYVYDVVPMREHHWVYYPTEDYWTTIRQVSEIRKRSRVLLHDYFNERRVIINHPRMK